MIISIYLFTITVSTITARGFLRHTQKLRYDAYISHADVLAAVKPKILAPLIVGRNKLAEYSWVEVGDQNYYRGINMIAVCKLNDIARDVEQKISKNLQLLILNNRIEKLNTGSIVSEGMFYSPIKLMTILVDILEHRVRCE